MAELAFDVLEVIMVRLDVKDVIRCKSVCKSWLSFISTPRFVKAHLNHSIKSDRDNRQLGHRRIHAYYLYSWNRIVGSCNGLVCINPKAGELLVINPSTREERILQTPPNELEEATKKRFTSWGFGYDSYSDDYKVVVGLEITNKVVAGRVTPPPTRFHVLSLKSNTWKVIGESKYLSTMGGNGILCDGVLYWFMANIKRLKLIIISFDLSTEELKKIPQPDVDYLFKHTLGLIQDRLCIYSEHSSKIWVMVNNKWELYIDRQQSKYDVEHYLSIVHDSQNKRGYVYSLRHDDGLRVPCDGKYISSSIFVKSLVSPHLS